MSEDFSRRMAERFELKFDLKLETFWNIFLNRLVSEREDGEPFTPEHVAWIAGYEAGYQDGGIA